MRAHRCTMPNGTGGTCNTPCRETTITSPRGRTITAYQCPICDRRQCANCLHYIQTPGALTCPKCKTRLDQ